MTRILTPRSASVCGTSARSNSIMMRDVYCEKYFPGHYIPGIDDDENVDADDVSHLYQSDKYYGIDTNGNKQLHVYQLFDDNEFLKEISIINTPSGVSFLPPLSGCKNAEPIIWAHHPDAGLFRWNLFSQKSPIFQIPAAFFSEETSYSEFVKLDKSWMESRFGGVASGDDFLFETCPELRPVHGNEDLMVILTKGDSAENKESNNNSRGNSNGNNNSNNLCIRMADLNSEQLVGQQFNLSKVLGYGQNAEGAKYSHQFLMLNDKSFFITTSHHREALISLVDVATGNVKSCVSSSRFIDRIAKGCHYTSIDFCHNSNRLFAGDSNGNVTIADLRMVGEESKLKRSDVVSLTSGWLSSYHKDNSGKYSVELLVKDNYVYTSCANQIQIFDVRKFHSQLANPIIAVSTGILGLNALNEENSFWFNGSRSPMFANFVPTERKKNKKKYNQLNMERMLNGHMLDMVVYKK